MITNQGYDDARGGLCPESTDEDYLAGYNDGMLTVDLPPAATFECEACGGVAVKVVGGDPLCDECVEGVLDEVPELRVEELPKTGGE